MITTLDHGSIREVLLNRPPEELHTVLDNWWSPETQNTLRAVLQKLNR
jgi:hypothetical protein